MPTPTHKLSDLIALYELNFSSNRTVRNIWHTMISHTGIIPDFHVSDLYRNIDFMLYQHVCMFGSFRHRALGLPDEFGAQQKPTVHTCFPCIAWIYWFYQAQAILKLVTMYSMVGGALSLAFMKSQALKTRLNIAATCVMAVQLHILLRLACSILNNCQATVFDVVDERE